MKNSIKTFRKFDSWIGRKDSEDYLECDDTPENRVYQMVRTDNPFSKVYTAKESSWIKLLKDKKIRIHGMSLRNNRLVENKHECMGKTLSEKAAGFEYERYLADKLRYNSLKVILPKKYGRYTLVKIFRPVGRDENKIEYVMVKDSLLGDIFVKQSLFCSTFENETFTNAVVLRGDYGGMIIPKKDVPIQNVRDMQDENDIQSLLVDAIADGFKEIHEVRRKINEALQAGWTVLFIDKFYFFIRPDETIDTAFGCKLYESLTEFVKSLKNVDPQIIIQDLEIFQTLSYASIFYSSLCNQKPLENLGYVLFGKNDDSVNIEADIDLSDIKDIGFTADAYEDVDETDISGVCYRDYVKSGVEFNKDEYLRYVKQIVSITKQSSSFGEHIERYIDFSKAKIFSENSRVILRTIEVALADRIASSILRDMTVYMSRVEHGINPDEALDNQLFRKYLKLNKQELTTKKWSLKDDIENLKYNTLRKCLSNYINCVIIHSEDEKPKSRAMSWDDIVMILTEQQYSGLIELSKEKSFSSEVIKCLRYLAIKQKDIML